VALTIAILSQKGGTGKTTMTRSLADIFGRVGLNTLAVDGDPQGNLSDYFDTDPEAQPTLGEVLTGQAKAVDAIHEGVIPANLGLAEAELVLSGKMGRELTMRNALRESKRRYDAILIDCPPTLGLLTVNALAAADAVLVPVQCEYYALEGLAQLLATIDAVRQRLNAKLRGPRHRPHDGRPPESALDAGHRGGYPALPGARRSGPDPAGRSAGRSAQPWAADQCP